MSNYQITDQSGFTVASLGVELKSDYTDYAGIMQEKDAFTNTVKSNGSLEKLQTASKNGELYLINEAYDNKMMYYFGVETDQALSDVTRNVEFPDGKYVVIEGSANDVDSLANELTGAMFGQVLNEVSDYAYVGGPNAVVVTEQGADQVSGKMIVPVVAK